MPDGYHHGYFSDGFVLTVGAPVDMHNWSAVAFLLNDATTTATAQSADDAAFTQNLTNLTEADHGAPISMPAASPTPFWLEVWRPRQRYVRVSGATGSVLAFQFRPTANQPPLPTPHRAGGRAS